MSKYTILLNGNIQRDDGAVISPDITKYDFQEYQEWVAAGNAADVEFLPIQAADEILEAAMRKCEAWMDSQGYTSDRKIDLLSDLLDESIPTERKARIIVVKNWLKNCKEATLANPSGVLDGSVEFPVVPLKYEEV